ncbi:MAG: penicillin-binding protein [Sphingobacteriales bacterium]|nr:MAG: penicillin-binding protein [Sphingobacteriales bacterium]
MQSQRPSRAGRAARVLWRLFLLGFAAFLFLVIALYYNWFGNMPSIDQYENPSAALASEVRADDGSLLGRYYVQDRSNSTYEEISPNVINALIATEDERFEEHSGVDGRAILRAVFSLGKAGGGSTITQQLAKNLFGRTKQSLLTIPIIKIREWVMAVRLERNLTKREIITLYLNTVPFPDNVYGIKNASLTFFSKTPDKLRLDEAAVLIGTLKGNSMYNPRTHADRALSRRNTVLDQMVKAERLDATTASDLKAKPVILNYKKISYHDGLAPYFRKVVESEVKKLTKDLYKSNGESYDIYKDGLKIYTTINPTMQRYAEEAVEEHLKSIQPLFFAQSGYGSGTVWNKQKSILDRAMKSSDRYKDMKESGATDAEIEAAFRKPVKTKVFSWKSPNHQKDTVISPLDSIKYTRMFLQAGFMVMEPETGEVKAWVGGIDHDYYQYDHVNIRATRQVGSTIKPLLYCLAVDNGISPCSNISTAAQSFPGVRGLYNAGGSKYGSMPMKKALASSVNNAALYLIKQVGIEGFVDFLRKCGVTAKIDPVPSMALGVSDISLYEMMRAYTMFPTSGMQSQPIFITKIEDKNGNLLKSFTPEQKEIISASTAFKMVKMMRGVVDFGTGARLRRRYNFTVDAGGKTGTTNSQADAWFMGYTPQLLGGVWVGCDDRFLSFRSEALGQGAAAALPIWALFMKKAYADKSLGLDPKKEFVEPENFDECSVTDPNSVTWGQEATYYGPVPRSQNNDPEPATGDEGIDESKVNSDADMITPQPDALPPVE